MPQILQVKELPSANKFLPAPLLPEEKVIVIEDIEGDQYIKVRHNKGKSFSRFNRRWFQPIKK